METPGVCSVCGCTEFDPCPGGCIWANSTATLCSRCATGAGELVAPVLELCEACSVGDHANCGRQIWCQCDCDPDDWAPLSIERLGQLGTPFVDDGEYYE